MSWIFQHRQWLNDPGNWSQLNAVSQQCIETQTWVGGLQCCFSPSVELWGISLLRLCQPLPSICVKLIGQKKVGLVVVDGRERSAGTCHFWIIQFQGAKAAHPAKMKEHPPAHFKKKKKLFFSPRFPPFEPSWIDLYVMLRNSVGDWGCTSLGPLFERDGAAFIGLDSWLCSRSRPCYDEVQWRV